MEEIEDLERDYLKDMAQIEAEHNERMRIEWQEWEEEYEKSHRLPAKIEIKIETNKNKSTESEITI